MVKHKEKVLNKIIYFDKETISNMLEELNRGDKISETNKSRSSNISGELSSGSKINIGMPFSKRLKFLISGELSIDYIKRYDERMSITSTELSEFEEIKPFLKEFDKVRLEDIENSSTFFRVAGHYLQMLKDGVEDVDINKFKDIMDNFDGYDTYKIQDDIYVRFNNSAFLSNYKRNELLLTEINILCAYVGEFNKNQFDFMEQINNMEKLIVGYKQFEFIADQFPPKKNDSLQLKNIVKNEKKTENNDLVKLYDVIYASITVGDKNV